MDGFRRVCIYLADNILINLLRNERNHRCRAQAYIFQGCIERHVGIDFILLHALRPETIAAAAHIPVAHIIDEALQYLAGLRKLISRQPSIGILDHGVHSGQKPAVHNRKFVINQDMFRRIEVVNVRVQYVECVGIPQGAEEFALAFLHGLSGKAVRQPWLGIGVEIPADRIRTVGVQRFHRIYRIALGLGHLFTILIQYKAEADDVLKCRAVEQQRSLRVKGIEPASGLIHSFADERSRKLFLEPVLIFKRIVKLRVRHGTGIKPAVNNLRHSFHSAAAVRTFDRHRIHIRTVKFDLLIFRIPGKLCQFFAGSDADSPAAVRAFPDVQRSAPVPVAGKTPVLNVLQPFSETPLADRRRNPVDFLIIFYQIIPHLGHFNKPGLPCVVNQGSAAAPAMRIIMFHLRSGEQNASLLQILQHFRIRTDRSFILHLMLRRFAAHTCELSGLRFHAAMVIHHLYKRGVIFAADTGIILTESRGNMDNTGTIRHGYIIIAVYKECFLVLFPGSIRRARIQRLIFPVFKILTLAGFQNLICFFTFGRLRSQHGIQQRSCHVVGVTVSTGNLCVFLFRIYAQGNIGRQCPRRRCPCQEISILILYLETNDRRALLQRFIALRNLMTGKRGAAARAVRYNLEPFVQKALIPDFLQRPPFRLNIVVIVGNIRMLHVSPESDLVGKLFPHAFIFPYGLFAFFDERFNPIFLDLILALDADLLFNLDLHRKAVGIPAGFSRNFLPLHAVITRNHVLDSACQNVSDVRLAVCCRRSVVKHVHRMSLIFLHTLVEGIIFLPELFNLILTLNKIHVR